MLWYLFTAGVGRLVWLFLNMFLSLMEDIDIKQIESFFEGFLKYLEYSLNHTWMIIIFKMSRAPTKISNIKCNYCPDTGGPNKNCLLLLMILYILETSILLVGATLIRCESYQLPMQVVKVLILLVHIVYIVEDLTGAHCAQQGRPSGLAPAQPRRSSQRVLHCWFVKK